MMTETRGGFIAVSGKGLRHLFGNHAHCVALQGPCAQLVSGNCVSWPIVVIRYAIHELCLRCIRASRIRFNSSAMGSDNRKHPARNASMAQAPVTTMAVQGEIGRASCRERV